MTEHTYDAVIVGARCAAASLAALMARRGASVMRLVRDRLPSTVSPIARWTLGAALRGRVRVVPEFFASGKRATAIQKEIAHRQVLAARAREAMA